MHTSSIRRYEGDANTFLRAALGLFILLAVTWFYWWMQFRI